MVSLCLCADLKIYISLTGSILKRPRTPPATSAMVDYQNADHEPLMKRLRPGHSVEEVTSMNFCSI